MFTFLPDEYKKQARTEYRLRLSIVCLFLACIFLALGAILTLPTFTVTKAIRDAVTLERDVMLKNLKDDPVTVEREIGFLNQKIALITATTGDKTLISVLERVLLQKGSGIIFSTLSLKRGTDTGTIVIGGVASTRDTLVAFSKRLQGEPAFSHINLPVGSLVKNKDIPFSISVDSAF